MGAEILAASAGAAHDYEVLDNHVNYFLLF
jgi:hypothetical protein